MDSFLARFLALWTRARLEPADIAARLRDSAAPVCYVLERRSTVDLAVLRTVCTRARLPRPRRRLLASAQVSARAVFALERPVGFWRSRLDRRAPAELAVLINALRSDAMLDVVLVPTAVFLGPAPQKERPLFRLNLAEDWAIRSPLPRGFPRLGKGRKWMG